ncbi:zinc finger BED domain-containing protein RICESLEEPER 2-like [Raphanus sativus]|uniref:Zinc finger BED domain-containing protein RICESLEEPER 2-like n=1 Tax=Raphanus sativus TaxID=3726 RepID=A0A6J0LSJ7_RAPSA|nr:zinc finger BED domain-containing protein RICESLEEPER 2-like [Raphanus sativus]
MYVKRKASMCNMFSSSKQHVSLTTDIWVAPSTAASYMVVTAHWIDTNWRLRKLIIGFKNVIDHKGVTIARVLEECLSEWSIMKIFTIIVDNATVNTNALKIFAELYGAIASDALVLDGRFLHMGCPAHIVNLVVKDGLKEIDDSICAIRNSITYVRSSTTRLNSFELCVLSGKTRWNSTYLMLSKALKFRLAFDRMEAEDKLYNEYFQETMDGKKRVGPPTRDDWDAVEGLVRFLVIFYNSTLVVFASNSVNSYKCYTEIVTIERNLIKLSNDLDVELRKKAMAMRENFNKYWEGLKKINRLLIVASILDPRNKMRFATLCFERVYGKDNVETKALQSSVADVLKSLFEEYTLRYVTVHGDDIIGTRSQSGATSSQSTGQDGSSRMDLDTDVG